MGAEPSGPDVPSPPPPPHPADEALLQAAQEVLTHAHAPYSGFRVGAALRTADGEVLCGVNVENASLGLTLCAERAAAAAAVAGGATDFEVLAVVTEADLPVLPCGACRQFLAEFAPGLRILAAGRDGTVSETTLEELLPGRFDHPR